MPDTAPPADGAAITSSWLQTMVREQVVRTVTSSTRPTGVEGAVIYETDTDLVYVYNGSSWVLSPVSPTAWTAVTFQNSWVNYSAAVQAVQYRKMGDIVQLRGMAKSGTIGAVMFTLPTGFRPLYQEYFAVQSNFLYGSVYIDAAGNVYAYSGSNTFFSVSGISFSTI